MFSLSPVDTVWSGPGCGRLLYGVLLEVADVMKRLSFFLLLAVICACPSASAQDVNAEPGKKAKTRPASWVVEKISKLCKNEPLHKLTRTKETSAARTEIPEQLVAPLVRNAEAVVPPQVERDPVNDGLRPYIDVPPAPIPPKPASELKENKTHSWLGPLNKWRKSKAVDGDAGK
jgi:hypothetical protein